MAEEKKFSHQAAAWTLLALMAASIEPIIVKIGYRGALTPFHLLIAKTCMAAVLILPITRRFRWIGGRGISQIATVSVLLLLNNMFTLMALGKVSAVLYLTLITTTPSIIALINSLAGRDRLSLKFWSGFLMCFTGVLLTLDMKSMAHQTTMPAGVLLVLGSMACTVLYRIRMEKITAEFTPVIVSCYIFWINAAMVLLFFVPWAGPMPVQAWTIGTWLGFAAAVANVAFLAALHILGSTRISIFNMLQRPLIIIAASLILHEPLNLFQVTGIVMVLAGIRLARVERLQQPAGQAQQV